METQKTCSTCKKEKATSEFNRHPHNKDGLAYQCRECSRIYARQYAIDHKDKRREYRIRTREQNNERSKQWAKNNREKVRKIMRAWYRKNRERAIEYRKKYLLKHPEKRRLRPETRQRQERQRAERLKFRKYTDEMWLSLRAFFGDKCLKCGATEEIVKDHVIPLALGGADHITNLQPLCRKCNAIKWDKTIEDYRDVGKLQEFLRNLTN